MAVNIGPKIGIDGEKQYRAEIQAIIQQGKTLAAQMGSVSTSFENAENKEEALTKVSKTLSDQITNQRALVDKLRDAVQKSAEKTGANSTATKKWEEQLYKAEKELNQLEGQTAESAAGVEQFGDEEEKTSKKTRIFGDVLKANLLSDAIKSGIKYLADGAKKLGKYFADAASGAAAYGDEINTLAVKTGISTDALQEYRYMAGLVDVEVETVAGAHAKLTKNMASAQKGTGAVYETFQKLGVSVTDASGRLRSADDVFNETIASLGKIDNETERDAASMQIFGKSAQELNPLIKAGAEELAAYRKEAHDVGAVLDQNTLKTLNKAQDQFERMGKAAEVLKNRIGASVFKTFSKELEEATAIMQDFASGKSSPEQIEQRLDKLFNNVLKKAEKYGDKALPIVGKAFEKIIKFAADNFPKVANKIIDKLPTVIDKIGQGAERQLPNLISKLGATIVRLISKSPEIIKAGLQLPITLAKGFYEGIKKIGPQMAHDLLSDTAKEAIETASRISEEIRNIPNALTEVKTSIGEVDAKQKEAEHWLAIYDDMRKKTELSKYEQEKLKTAVEKLNELFPDLGLAIDEETGIWNQNTETIRKNIEALGERARAEAYYAAASDALEKQVRLEYEINAAIESRKTAVENQKYYTDKIKEINPILLDISNAYSKTNDKAYLFKDAIKGLSNETLAYIQNEGIQINSTADLYNALITLSDKTKEFENGLASANAEVESYDSTIANAEKGLKDYAKQIDYFFGKGDEWASKAGNIGSAIPEGIAKGMNQKRGIVIDTGTSIMKNTLAAMRNVALIASPSKVTTQYGEMLTIGLPKGMKKKEPEAVKEAQDVMQNVISSMRDAETFETSLRVNARRTDNVAAIIGAMHTNGAVTNNNTSNTNLGGVSVNVYAAPNQDANAIARQVVAEMTNTFNSKKAVFA